MDPLLPSDPERIGRYRLTHRLGAGGMGQVYLARTTAGRRIVVKVIRPEHISDGEFRARFAREAGAARTVGGFHTAQVVDADPEADPPWIATAHIVGPSLHQFLREQGALAPPTLRVLAAGLAEGLEAIHTAGLVHRDLKPGNVILAEDGPRIIDFGIARPLDTTHMTASGAVLGTVPYMSPEQTEGIQVGPASDVFSLGTVLVFAATGTNPYAASTPAATIRRIIGPTPPLPGLPDDLTALITGCWDHDPDQRLTPAQILARFEVDDLDGAWPPAPGPHPPPEPPATRSGPPEPPFTPAAPSEPPAAATTPPVDIETLSGAGQQSGTDAVSDGYVTPLVRKLAADEGVDLSAVRGTGFGGRIRKQDVQRTAQEQRERAAAEPAGAPEPATGPAEAAVEPAGGPDGSTAGRSNSGPAESPPASREGADNVEASVLTRKRAWVVAGAMAFAVALVAAGAVWLPSSSTSEPATPNTTPEQEPVTPLTGHDAEVWSMAFAPEGGLLATGSEDDTARVWDVASGEEVTTVDHGAAVLPVMFSEAGDTLATTGGAPATTRVWDVESGQEISSIEPGNHPSSVEFTEDGDTLATSGGDGAAVRVWDLESGEESFSIDHDVSYASLAFALDGDLLATTGDGVVGVWDVASGEEVTTLGHGAHVESVEFAPDGDLLAVSGTDGTSRVWDVASEQEVTTIDHDDDVMSVMFSEDGGTLATTGDGAAVRVWDLESGQEVATVDHGAELNAVEFAPEGDLLATGGVDGTSRVWDVASGEEVTTFSHDGEVGRSMAFAPDGETLATGGDDGTVHLWDVP